MNGLARVFLFIVTAKIYFKFIIKLSKCVYAIFLSNVLFVLIDVVMVLKYLFMQEVKRNPSRLPKSSRRRWTT